MTVIVENWSCRKAVAHAKCSPEHSAGDCRWVNGQHICIARVFAGIVQVEVLSHGIA